MTRHPITTADERAQTMPNPIRDEIDEVFDRNKEAESCDGRTLDVIIKTLRVFANRSISGNIAGTGERNCYDAGQSDGMIVLARNLLKAIDD